MLLLGADALEFITLEEAHSSIPGAGPGLTTARVELFGGSVYVVGGGGDSSKVK